MTSTDTVLDRTAGDAAPAEEAATVTQAAGARATTLALSLWVVVGSLLAYGVLQTALKASALFG